MESSYFNASLAVNESEKDNKKKKCLLQTSTWSTSLSEWRTPKVWGCRRILLMHNSPALWCLRSQRFMASRSAAAPVISPLLFSCASFNVWRVTGRRCQQSMGAFLGLIMSSNAQFVLNSSEWRHCVRARGGVHGTTYPTPPFLFDLAHLSCAVSGSLLELPPWWLCPLDGEGGGGGGWGGGEMAEMEGVLWGLLCEGGWDDRLGRPTPEHFHKSRVSKQASVCGKPRNPEECTPSTGREGVLQASVGGKRLQRHNTSPGRSELWSLLTPKTALFIQLSMCNEKL